MRVALFLVAINLNGQPAFPLRPLAESVGVASLREERPGVARLEGRDRAGRPWRVWLDGQAAYVSTSYWVADFDHDGQPDLLITRPLPGLGTCVGRGAITILRLDGRGRPVPLVLESNALPVAIRRRGDGTAEFLTSEGCADAGHWVGLPVTPGSVRGRLEEIRSGEFGCRAMQRNTDRLSIEGNRVEPLPDPCAESAGPGLLISGRWVHAWPSRVVVDTEEGRDIYLCEAWLGLRRAFAEGRDVRFDGEELWADGIKRSRGVEVTMHVTAMRRGAAGFFDARSESTVHKLDAERNAIHTAHSAFGVTHRHTTEYEAPTPGARLASLESSYGLTQWRSGRGLFFALHDEGRLREPLVLVTVSGQLMPGEDGPVFRQKDHAFAVQGYLRWRALP